MALESSFLAAENSASERRTWSVYRFIAASPVALLLTVGIVGHLTKPSHAGASGTSDYDRRVLAYRERIVRVGDLAKERCLKPAIAVEAEARAWVRGYASGSLRPLPPAAYEDHLRDSVRGEIVLAGISLGWWTIESAQASLEAGDPVAATDLALLAAEAVKPLADSEIFANVQVVMAQRRPLDIVSRSWPKLPERLKSAFRKRIRALVHDPASLERMADLERRQLHDYGLRQRLDGSGDELIRSGMIEIARKQKAASKNAAAFNVRIDVLLRAH